MNEAAAAASHQTELKRATGAFRIASRQWGVTLPNTFISLLPMSLDEAVHLLEDEGCTVEKREADQVIAMCPKGKYVRVTSDIDGYTTVSVNLCSGAMIASDGLATADSVED